MSSLIVGYPFDGAVGLKTGKNLEDLVALAKFAPSSDMLDQVTITEDIDGRAVLKDLGITLAKINDSVIGDGLEKDGGAITVVVDGVTLQIVGGALKIKNPTDTILADNVTLELHLLDGNLKLRIKPLGVDTEHLKSGAVTGPKIAADTIDFSKWDVETLTTDETPPVSLAEGKLHIVYEEV